MSDQINEAAVTTGRRRNARRVILGDLRLINKWMQGQAALFNPGGKVYPGESGEREIRPRRRDEYIENQPAELRRFATGARKVAEALLLIAEYAEERADEVDAELQEHAS